MKRLSPACLLVLALALLRPHATAASAQRLPDSFDVNAIDAYLEAQVRQRDRVGLSVAVVKDGKMVLAKGYGKASLEPNRPVGPDTMFAIGSVSKQFTCACILLLAEDGTLSVDDPVAKYYPELTRAADITLLDLMQHTSGYPDYYPLDFVDRRMAREIAPDALLRQYAGARLDFEPGSRWSYSNTGFILLARVAERVSGTPFGRLLEERIFKPLGMTRTAYEIAPDDPRLARGYASFALSPPMPVAPEGAGWLGGAGGIASTPSDLARWNLALIEGRLLKPESWKRMTTPRVLPDGRYTQYGCGVSLGWQSGRPVVTHNGAVSGFNAWSGLIPSTRSCVVMLCNRESGLDGLPGQVFGLLAKDDGGVPAVAGPGAPEVSRQLFLELQKGKVNRARLAEEFNAFLSASRVADAARRLKPFGAPAKAELVTRRERGGLEVSTVRLTFKSTALSTLMYRRPDGTIEQFFVERD